jgi:hypothetical protein
MVKAMENIMEKIKALIRFDWFVKFFQKDKNEAYYKNLREENSRARTLRAELRAAKKEQALDFAQEMKMEGEPVEKIKKYTGLRMSTFL